LCFDILSIGRLVCRFLLRFFDRIVGIVDLQMYFESDFEGIWAFFAFFLGGCGMLVSSYFRAFLSFLMEFCRAKTKINF
jgi:hypothetical protein